MLQADIIGAMFVLGFLRYGLPPEDRVQLQDLPRLNVVVWAISLIVVFLANALVNLRMLMPVFRWQRGDLLLLDNYLVTHGRMPFRGERKILVAID